MRKAILAGLIVLLAATEEAPAQMAGGTKSKDTLRADWYKQCMQDWDASTHMTKREWERVCRRVADDRANPIVGEDTMPVRSKKP